MANSVDAFHADLRRTGGYESARRVGKTPCRSVWRTLRYHMRVIGTIAAASRTARRGAFDRRTWAATGWELLRTAECWGADVRFEGFAPSEDMAPPRVWVANHMSSLETFVLPAALLAFGDVCVVLKRSLLRYPLFGPPVSGTEPIAVTRANPRRDLMQVLTEGKRVLDAGRSVLLFPQSTRSHTFDSSAFNSLGTKLADRAGVPLVPVALRTDFAGMGRVWRDFGPVNPALPVRFAAGAPLEPATPPRERQARAVAFIAGRLKSWGVEVV